MSEPLKVITAQLTESTHEKLKLLSVINKTTMRDILERAINQYAEQLDNKKEITSLRHKLYRLKYDAHEKDK